MALTDDEWVNKQKMLQTPADMIRDAHATLVKAQQQLKGLAKGGVRLDADDRLVFVTMQMALVEEMKSLRRQLHEMYEN